MVWVVNGIPKLHAEAWGGVAAAPGATFKIMKPERTKPGRYVIHSYGSYVTNSWPMAKIRWGTPLKVEGTGNDKYVLYQTGTTHRSWKRVDSIISVGTYLGLQGYFRMMYGDDGHYDHDHDGIPDKWVFNEFGPKAVRYFKDLNDDGVLDGNEQLMGDMIHTTPQNEAQYALDLEDPEKKKKKTSSVKLDDSHGCVHISPRDRDRLHGAGAFDKGTIFIVHGYNEPVPAFPRRLNLPEAPAPTETQTGRLEKEKTFFDVLVVDDDDKPLAGQRYKLELPDGTVEEGRLGADGRLARRNIDPGTAQLTLLPDDPAPDKSAAAAPAEPASAEPEPEETEQQEDSEEPDALTAPELPSLPIDTVAFLLIDGEGKPIAKQAVKFTLADGSTREALTDGDGKVLLAGVPPGDCQATIEGVGDGEMEPV